MHLPLVRPFLWPRAGAIGLLITSTNTKIPTSLTFAGEEQGVMSQKAAKSQHKPDRNFTAK